MKIVPVTANDYALYANLRIKLAEENKDILPWDDADKHDPEYFSRNILNGTYKLFFLVDYNEKVVGFVNGKYFYNSETNFVNDRVIIQIGILKGYLGCGYGRLLLDTLIDKWCKCGHFKFLLFVSPNNKIAIKLYESFKFVRVNSVELTEELKELWGELDYYELLKEVPKFNPESFNKLPILTVCNPDDLKIEELISKSKQRYVRAELKNIDEELDEAKRTLEYMTRKDENSNVEVWRQIEFKQNVDMILTIVYQLIERIGYISEYIEIFRNQLGEMNEL